MDLIPDERWSVFQNGETFESYCNHFVPSFQYSSDVPEIIQRRCEIVRRLIVHAYYEYEFLDIALERAFQTLELALHLKHTMLYPNHPGKKNLKPYLDWALQNNIINIKEDQKQTLNYLRNGSIHLKNDKIGGTTTLAITSHIGNDLINQIFRKIDF